ncbi:MAG: hypothetical protein OXL36_19780 [Bryobacterales bacterium]|nr:hypothetical protein [Bryobacterales bacterium]MDE0296954.1 hypothetical protein [Bryobacterales bacterium]
MIGELIGEIVKFCFKGLIFFTIGFALEFNWLFWLLVLYYIFKLQIDDLLRRFNNYLKNLTEKLDYYNKNRPPL